MNVRASEVNFFANSCRRIAWFLISALLLLHGATPHAQATTVILVTSLADKVSSSGGCSLKEAIFAANFNAPLAVDKVNDVDGTDHFITTSCVLQGFDYPILIQLPIGAVFTMNTVAQDAHNPYGPGATPMIFQQVTILGNGSELVWAGSPQVNARAFTIGFAEVTLPYPTPLAIGLGIVTMQNLHIKGFTAQGGSGIDGSGGGLGAGGAIYVSQNAQLLGQDITFEANRAVGGNGGAAPTGGGGGGGGMGGDGGGSSWGGGGGGGSAGPGGIGNIVFAPDTSFFGYGGGGGGTIGHGWDGTAGTALGGALCGGGGGVFDGDAGFSATCNGGGGAGGNGGAELVCGLPGCQSAGGNGGNGDSGGGGGGGGGGVAFLTNGGSDGGNGGFGGGGGGSGGNGDGGNGGFGGGAGAGPGNITGGPGNKGEFGGSASKSVGGGGAGLGGAIFNNEGIVEIQNSTFTTNDSLGGRKGNASDSIAGTGEGHGGAIFSLDGTIKLLNVTVAGNLSSGAGGGIYIHQENHDPTTFLMRNTIIANNGGSTDGQTKQCTLNVSVNTSGDFRGNLIQNDDSSHPCDSSPSGIVSTADPKLGALQQNYALVPTMALLAGSPAIDTGDSGTDLPFDERGVKRPQGSGPDIGAYEVCVSSGGGGGLLLALQSNPGEPDCVPPQPTPTGTATLTMQVSPVGSGTTTPPVGSLTVPQGSVQAMTVTANPGYQFSMWSANVTDPTDPSTTVLMGSDQIVTAYFTACGCAADVTSQIKVTFGGFTLNPVTGRYSQTVTLTNNSANTISSPISLVLDNLSTNATLYNQTGITDGLEPPSGSPYVNVSSSNLAAGGSVSFALQFTDSAHTAITYTTRVLSGPGLR